MARSHKSSLDNIKSFDSIEALYEFASNIDTRWRGYSSKYLGQHKIQSWDDCMRCLSHGSTENVDAAQRIIDQMADAGIFSEGEKIVSTSLVGFMPCIPNYLSGQPDDMFTLVDTDNVSMSAPLRIYFETTVHAGTDARELINRGVAIMAFALAMSRIRTVEVHALSISSATHAGAYGVAVRLPTTPMDLSRVAYVMTTQGYSRNIGFSCVHAIQENTNPLLLAWYGANNADREASIRDTFNLEPTDVVITRETEELQMMLRYPIRWVQQMIAKHTGTI